MKQTRFDEAQIIGILKQQEAGVTVAAIWREHAISEGTFYRWKSKYGGMEVHEATRLRQLEHENARLKKLLAESMPLQRRLEGCAVKKMVKLERSASTPAMKKEVAGYLQEQHKMSNRRACALVGLLTPQAERWDAPRATKAVAWTMRRFGRASKNWRKNGLGSATDVWACCCAARVTRSTQSACCAFTARRS